MATIVATGSCKGMKKDEGFIVGYGSIVSETALRVMNDESNILS